MRGVELKKVKCDCSRSAFQKVSVNKKKQVRNKKISTVVSWAATVSLIAAYAYGFMYRQVDYGDLIEETISVQKIESVGESMFKIHTSDGEDKFVGISTESGYGGPLVTGPVVNQEGVIEQVLLLDDKETRSFIQKLKNNGFFKQFEGKHIEESLTLNDDINAITGATISSEAITKAVSTSAHTLGTKQFDIQYKEVEEKWEITTKDYAAVGIFLLAALALKLRKKWLRNLSLVASMLVLGFYFNSAINVSQFGRVLLGYIPALKSNIFWFVLVFGSIGYAFFFKKNIYCQAMCPFHAVETILIKIGGLKITFPKSVAKIAKHSAKFLLWLSLIMIFLSQNPAIGSYEPFAMVFGLEGSGIQWYILPAVLIGVLLITDYFCRYFCPVGRGLGYVIKLRKWIDGHIIGVKPKSLSKVKS